MQDDDGVANMRCRDGEIAWDPIFSGERDAGTRDVERNSYLPDQQDIAIYSMDRLPTEVETSIREQVVRLAALRLCVADADLRVAEERAATGLEVALEIHGQVELATTQGAIEAPHAGDGA